MRCYKTYTRVKSGFEQIPKATVVIRNFLIASVSVMV